MERAICVLGGAGMMREYRVGRHHRDVMVYLFGEGASDIQRNLISRAMKERDVDPAASFMIGDKDSDVAAAKAAGIPGFHFTAGSLDKFVANILETWPCRDSMRAAPA